MFKKIMIMVSLSAVVCGGIYYFLSSPKEQTVLTSKVTPAIESEVKDNIEKRKNNKLIMPVYLNS